MAPPQTGYLKEHERIVPNSIGQLSVSSSPARLWSSFGQSCQTIFGDYGKINSSNSMEQISASIGKHINLAKDGNQLSVNALGLDKLNNNSPQFSLFPGDGKNTKETQKISPVFPMPEHHSRFDLGFGQPMICANHPYMDQHYGILSAYRPQIPGRVLLPMSLTTDDGPIYVNAKQYHGIIRRRQSRAKALMENRVTRTRKPYMHESRHLHAMRRPRGLGGRFLNTKKLKNEKNLMKTKKLEDINFSDSSGSQCSVVLQSESGTFNSSKEGKGSGLNLMRSEVSSMFSRGIHQRFQINHLGPSMQSLAEFIDGGGHGMVLPKWVAAADNCRDLCV